MREEPLPGNPNCVAFATEAARLFHAAEGPRSWADLQRLAAGVAQPFHDQSQLPTLAGYTWRVALDRKNERSLQGQLYFVFDGPATSEHLDLLEAGVQALELGFGPATIERAPPLGAPAVYVCGGRAHAVWSPDEAGGEPTVRRLELVDGRILPSQLRAADVAPSDHLPELPDVVGVPAPYSESERETERMRLAFALRLVDRIVRADGVVREDEERFVESLFPPDLLQRLGLDDPAAVNEYFAEACEALPIQLGHHDKLALVGLFFSACCSDGSLDAREMRVLKEGGEMLGLSKDQVTKYLQRFW